MIRLYLAVTNDEYELPLAVADSVVELSKMIGVSCANIYSNISRGTKGMQSGITFLKLEFENVED